MNTVNQTYYITDTQNLRINRKNINIPKQLTVLSLFAISMEGPLSTNNILQPEGNAKTPNLERLYNGDACINCLSVSPIYYCK